jgi:hypothetical protein
MWTGIADRLALGGLAVVTALAGAPRARADEPPPASGGALHVVADPARPVLATEVTVDVRVSAPPEVEELSLTASAGRIEGVRRLPGGGFVARYRPPAERIPQVAIVAAMARTGRGVEDGWVAIPMSGHGTARVRGAPGAAVSLRIGDRTFGPQTAGSDGVAAIPVVVPPGIREGHQGFRPIDLHVPETSLLHAVAERASVHADREERVRVVVYVVAPHGAARRGDAPAFEPSRGTVSCAEREAGAWVATWTIPPGPAGEERLVARLPSAPVSRAAVRVAALPGPAAVVAVSIDRAELVAGGEGATVLARTLDGAGNAVPAALSLEVKGGLLEAVEERRPGVVAARLSAGTRLQGDEAVVTATAPTLGIAGSRAVPTRPAEPASARFARRDVVVGDGARATALRVAVADRFGNPVAAAPEVSAARGRIAGITAAGPGAYDVRYVPPAVERPVSDTVVARIRGAEATLAPVVAPPAPALRIEALAGPVLDLRGRFAGLGGLLGAERPGEVDAVLRLGLEPALRLEAGGLSGPGDGTRAVLLAGPAIRRAAGALALGATATGGALLGGGAPAPAARLAVSLALARAGVEPFVELSVLGAGDGAPGAFVTAGLAAGVRLGLKGSP